VAAPPDHRIETDLFRIQSKILRDRRHAVATPYGKTPDRVPDARRSRSPRLQQSRLIAAGASQIAARSRGLVDTMPRCGSKPLRPRFCLAQSDAGEALLASTAVISYRSLPMLNGAEVSVALDQCRLLQSPGRAEIW
jgi:hypothetical protein